MGTFCIHVRLKCVWLIHLIHHCTTLELRLVPSMETCMADKVVKTFATVCILTSELVAALPHNTCTRDVIFLSLIFAGDNSHSCSKGDYCLAYFFVLLITSLMYTLKLLTLVLSWSRYLSFLSQPLSYLSLKPRSPFLLLSQPPLWPLSPRPPMMPCLA